MSTLVFRGDSTVATCEGSGAYVTVPFAEGGDMYLYVNETGSLVVGDSPPAVAVPAQPAASEAKPKKTKK